MKTTRYFEEQARRKRPYLKTEMIEAALANPIARVKQPDGRIRLWARVNLAETDKSYIIRIVVLDDGETVHNAFFDRDYREAGS
jgi:hypothetical protein